MLGDIYIVVQTEEFVKYNNVLASELAIGLQTVPLNSSGIADTRYQIGIHAEQHGIDRFCVIDDDLQFLIRIDEHRWNLRNQDYDDVRGMITYLDHLSNKYAHGAVSAREGNSFAEEGDRDWLLKLNGRALRCHFFRTKEYLDVKHCRLAVMEDFDVTLQLLEQGFPNAITFWYANGQAKTQSPGGCSIYRTKEVHEESARKLAELHPRFVRLRQKENKTDAGEFGSRLEVTVQWGRAYRSSQ